MNAALSSFAVNGFAEKLKDEQAKKGWLPEGGWQTTHQRRTRLLDPHS